MIEKAPIVDAWYGGDSEYLKRFQRDADHKYYMEQFVKEINNVLGMCSERSPRWRAVVLALESLLPQAGEK